MAPPRAALRLVPHPQTVAPAALEGEQTPAATRLPSVWACHRLTAALAVRAALRALGVTAGMCARWWHESPQRAAERLRGTRPLCAEHLAALPPRARAAALEALHLHAVQPQPLPQAA